MYPVNAEDTSRRGQTEQRGGTSSNACARTSSRVEVVMPVGAIAARGDERGLALNKRTVRDFEDSTNPTLVKRRLFAEVETRCCFSISKASHAGLITLVADAVFVDAFHEVDRMDNSDVCACEAQQRADHHGASRLASDSVSTRNDRRGVRVS